MLLRMLRLPHQIGNGRTHLPPRLRSMSCHLGMRRFFPIFFPCHRCLVARNCHFFCHKLRHHPSPSPGGFQLMGQRHDTWVWTNETGTMNECRKTLSCCLLSLLPSVSICGPVSSNLGLIQSMFNNSITFNNYIWYYMFCNNYMTICPVWTFGQRGLIYNNLHAPPELFVFVLLRSHLCRRFKHYLLLNLHHTSCH